MLNLYAVENAQSSMLERLRAGEVMDLGVFLKVTPGPGLSFLEQRLDPQPELLLLLLLLVTSGPAQPLSCVGHANACGRNKHTNSTYWNTHTHTLSFCFDLFTRHVRYHHDCFQALHRKPEPDP